MAGRVEAEAEVTHQAPDPMVVLVVRLLAAAVLVVVELTPLVLVVLVAVAKSEFGSSRR